MLVVCGPGNNGVFKSARSSILTSSSQSSPNCWISLVCRSDIPTTGGDGLVCARHLHHYGYTPAIYYPKPSKPDLFKRLVTQLKNLNLTFIDPEASDPSSDSLSAALESASLIVDSLFGFSFSPPVRAPFDKLISHLESPDRKTPVLSVDIPSSWDVTSGPPSLGQVGHSFMPEFLISLTAPKPCTKYFKGGRHFVGGRFVPSGIADKFGLGDVMSRYEGYEQICEVPVEQEGIGGGGKL